MSRMTQVGNDCDDRLKDCNLKLGGQPMAWDVTSYDKFMFFQPPVFKGEEIGCMSVNRYSKGIVFFASVSAIIGYFS